MEPETKNPKDCTMCGEGEGINKVKIGQTDHLICDECRQFLIQ